MAYRYLVRVNKPFDNAERGAEIFLSSGGFERMSSKMPEHITLIAEEGDDGKLKPVGGDKAQAKR